MTKDLLTKYNIEFHNKEVYNQVIKLVQNTNYSLNSLETLCLFIESQIPAIEDSIIKINGSGGFILEHKKEDKYLTLLFHSEDNMMDFMLITPSRYKERESRSLYGTMYYLDLIQFLKDINISSLLSFTSSNENSSEDTRSLVVERSIKGKRVRDELMNEDGSVEWIREYS